MEYCEHYVQVLHKLQRIICNYTLTKEITYFVNNYS